MASSASVWAQTAEHRAVLGRDFIQIFCSHEAARARHVLSNDGRAARQMSGQELGDQAAVNVVAPARPIADKHAQRFAAIKIGDWLRVAG